MTADKMTLTTAGHTNTGGRWVSTQILRGTRIRAIDQALAKMDDALVVASDAQRRLETARTALERFDDNAMAEAIVAGAVGEKFDAAASRARKVEATQAVEDLELELAAARSAVDSARGSYMTALGANVDKLRQSARDEALLAMQEMTVAQDALAKAATRLGAAMPIVSSAGELAVGMAPTIRAPRTAADNINDGGHPASHAAEASASVETAMEWLARWIARADEEAEARKAASKAEAKGEAA